MAKSALEQRQGVTLRLSEYAAGLTYESLPPEVVSAAKALLLDTLGTTLAGTTLGAGCREVVEVVRNAGGTPESTLLGFGDKVPAVMAAFANGATAHALNYDTIGEVGHLGVTALAAPLAVAERAGGVSGKEFLTAVVAGTEVTARTTAAVVKAGRRPSETFLAGQLLGYMGAAAGAGRVLRLSVDQMQSAIGLAVMQASGSMQVVLDGDPPAKAIYGAFPNHGGVLSVLLSQAGVGARFNALEGRLGFYGMFYGGDYDGPALDDDLGKGYWLMGVGFKMWPTSGVVHPFIEAAMDLVSQGAFTTAEIEQVRCTGDDHIRAWCEPIADRRRPQNTASAGNSVLFNVAKTLVNGKVTLADMTPEGLAQPEALELAQRVDYAIDDSLHGGGIVEVTTKAGTKFSARVDTPLGQPSRPVGQERLVEKFRDCVQYAAKPLDPKAVDQVIDLIDHLEEIPDVSALPALVSGRA